MKKIFFLILLAVMNNSYAQTFGFLPKGLGVEVGLGYNQLKVKVVEPFSSESNSRNEFKLTPTFRISYDKEVINNFSIMPFVGYSIIGGKSFQRTNGYEDEYIFKTLDFGLFASYMYNDISFSIGGKYNRFLGITGRYYGYYDQPANAREWVENDMSALFRKWSIELGGRTSYNINNITISLEGWFNITELSGENIEDLTKTNSNRFQLLVGYRL